MACIFFCQTGVHMSAISCMVVAILESYISFQFVDKSMCSRLFFLEANALIAVAFLLVLTLLGIVESYIEFDGHVLSPFSRFISQFVPWMLNVTLLMYEVVCILINHKLILT